MKVSKIGILLAALAVAAFIGQAIIAQETVPTEIVSDGTECTLVIEEPTPVATSFVFAQPPAPPSDAEASPSDVVPPKPAAPATEAPGKSPEVQAPTQAPGKESPAQAPAKSVPVAYAAPAACAAPACASAKPCCKKRCRLFRRFR